MASMFGSAADWQYGDEHRSAYISFSRVNGEANELVYCQPWSCPESIIDPPADWKLSQLIWRIKNVELLGAGVSFTSRNGVSLNLDGKFHMAGSSGAMDDYDWLYNIPDWTHWSHHEDTRVVKAQILDANIAIDLSKARATRLAFLLGYKQEAWGWESRGGYLIYSDIDADPPGFRDITGTIPDGMLAISYEQQFSMPYIGLRLDAQLADWTFNAEYRYSSMVKVTAVDVHPLRIDLTPSGLMFEESFADGVMTAYALGLGYRWGSLGLHAAYQVQTYEEVRGNTLYREPATGQLLGGCWNCAGADNTTKMLTLGLSLVF